MAEKKTTVWECDGCGHVVLADPSDSEYYDKYATGFAGTVENAWSREAGVEYAQIPWFACKPACLRKAITSVRFKSGSDES
jgi:hypothetical protein